MKNLSTDIELKEAFVYDKERIKKAFDGKLINENGEYESATKEQCDSFILSVLDNAEFHVLDENCVARAIQNFAIELVGIEKYSEKQDRFNEILENEMAKMKLTDD